MASPAGWYPDPRDSTHERYWSGVAWSDQIRSSVPSIPAAVATPSAPAKESYGAMVARRLISATVVGIIGLIIAAFANR